MPGVKYRDVPSDDASEDAGVDNVVATQPLELEAAHVRRNNAELLWLRIMVASACFFALLLAAVWFGVHDGKEESAASHASLPEEAKKEGNEMGDGAAASRSLPQEIFCYGDSLTYGISCPGREAHPYAVYLEQELNNLYASDPAGPPAVQIQHMGTPGITASYLESHLDDARLGACPIISRIPTLSLMIILIGTNDLGQPADDGKDVAKSIFGSIMNLHGGVLSCLEGAGNGNLHTLAIGIPGSAYQNRVKVAADHAAFINDALEAFAADYPGHKVSYLDFPFDYESGDPKWCVDGLHLTEEGYKELARSLAPNVKAILDKIER
ncbi:hypothetical protein ACHAXT_002866 [Thalassiosira profunda]